MIDVSKSPAPVADSPSADPALLQTALAAQKDDYLRLAADFDNFRKRTRRDSEQQAAAEKESFIQNLLPILDNLERALACEGATSTNSRPGKTQSHSVCARAQARFGPARSEPLSQTEDHAKTPSAACGSETLLALLDPDAFCSIESRRRSDPN